MTNSYWFRESCLSKFCFIIICEEPKRFWSWTPVRNLLWFWQILVTCVSKHWYCRCFCWLKYIDHLVLFSLFTKIFRMKSCQKQNENFCSFETKTFSYLSQDERQICIIFVCMIFAHWCATWHWHFPLSHELETWLGKPTPKQTFFRKMIFWMHYFWMRSKLMKPIKFLCPLII